VVFLCPDFLKKRARKGNNWVKRVQSG
jgi:hypothetical protein